MGGRVSFCWRERAIRRSCTGLVSGRAGVACKDPPSPYRDADHGSACQPRAREVVRPAVSDGKLAPPPADVAREAARGSGPLRAPLRRRSHVQDRADASDAGVGSVGFWTKGWRDELVYELGWIGGPKFRPAASRWRRPRGRSSSPRDDRHRTVSTSSLVPPRSQRGLVASFCC